MNKFVAMSTMRKLEKKYRICPYCTKETEIKMEEEMIYISCKCGFYMVSNKKGEILSKIYDDNGNARCSICGDKVEGGYCSCFNKYPK